MDINHLLADTRLHSSGNFKAPVSCLPSELLSIIFEAFRDRRGFLYVKQIVHLSHVCQFWRDVTLSTPTLWTTVELEIPLATEYLMRSQSLPLRLLTSIVPVRSYMLHVPSSASWLQNNAHRVQQIDIRSGASAIKKLFDVLGNELPVLSSLTLHTSSRVTTIPTLFAPKLRLLDVTNVIINFDVLKDLTHLCIAGREIEDVLNINQLLGVVGRSPGLQVLRLGDIYTNTPATRPPNTEITELHHLSKLEFDNIMPGLTEFILSHIFIPSSSPLVCSSYLDPYYFVIDFSRIRFTIRRDANDTTLDIKRLQYNLISTVPVLTTSIDMSLIQALRAVFEDGLTWHGESCSAYAWTIIFGALSSLSDITLQLPACCMRNALQVLYPDEFSGVVLCPKLVQLRLIVGGHTIRWYGPVPLDGVVLGCLEARSRCGLSPMKTLVMNFGEDSIVDELERIVEEFVREVCVLWPTGYEPRLD